MIRLLQAEWLKLHRRWMTRIIILLTLAIIALLFWGNATRLDSRPDVLMPRAWLVAIAFTGVIAAFIWPILAGNWAGSEYGWGTVRMILSRRPDRIQWALAALLALTIAAAIALLLAAAVGSLAGIIIAAATSNSIFDTAGLQAGYAGILIKGFLGSWFILVFYILLAYAAGTLFRSGAFGIGTGIGLTIAQTIALGIFNRLGGTWKTIADHFPFVYTNALSSRLVDQGTTPNFAEGSSTQPGIPESVIALAIYCAILLAITLFLVRVRDVTD